MVETQRGVELRVLGQQQLRGYDKADLKCEGNLTETQELPITETEKKY